MKEKTKKTAGAELREMGFTMFYYQLGKGRISLCFKKEDKGYRDIHISFCSPKDRFSKRIAHQILLGRVKGNKAFEFYTDLDLYQPYLLQKFFRGSTYKLPSWVKKGFLTEI